MNVHCQPEQISGPRCDDPFCKLCCPGGGIRKLPKNPQMDDGRLLSQLEKTRRVHLRVTSAYFELAYNRERAGVSIKSSITVLAWEISKR